MTQTFASRRWLEHTVLQSLDHGKGFTMTGNTMRTRSALLGATAVLAFSTLAACGGDDNAGPAGGPLAPTPAPSPTPTSPAHHDDPSRPARPTHHFSRLAAEGLPRRVPSINALAAATGQNPVGQSSRY